MIRVAIHGNVARYTKAAGWTCNDALTERFLNASCASELTNEARNEAEALTKVQKEYPDGRLEMLDSTEPAPEESSRQRTGDEPEPREINPQTTGQAQPGPVDVDRPTLGS